jgi:hypothetical protein
MRKQGASLLLIECALERADIIEEIDDLDAAYGSNGTAEAFSVSYFLENDANDGPHFLGQATVINYRKHGSTLYTNTYIYDSILPPPMLPNTAGVQKKLLNNFLSSEREFLCRVDGQEHLVRGVYYCQQNGITQVCAHACLRMALNPITNGDKRLSPRKINEFLKLQGPIASLNMQQIVDVICQLGGQEAEVIDCASIAPSEHSSILASIIESGNIALLVFTTRKLLKKDILLSGPKVSSPNEYLPQKVDSGQTADRFLSFFRRTISRILRRSARENEQHVVTVFGHTRNSDEWHPQAIPGYAGPLSAQYYPSSAWIDHFLIHDDNFGSYYTLDSGALSSDKRVRAKWIIAVRPVIPSIRSDVAETYASTILRHLLPDMARLGNGRWAEYLAGKRHTPVLRTILMDRDVYIKHLLNATDHDGSRATSAELDVLRDLPGRFWMIEFTLAPLFTGNRSKLGEVLIRASSEDYQKNSNPPSPMDITLGVRLPGIVWLSRTNDGMSKHSISLSSHSPIFRLVDSDHEW